MKSNIKKILIVDDVADDRLIAKMILEKEGYQIVEAKDWKEALHMIKNGDLSLVLLDLKMPEMNGLELLGKIRKENLAEMLPIVVYSSSPNICDDYRSYGSDGYIKKYSDPCILISKVKEVLK